MLGLGNSIISGSYSSWSPEDVDNLTLWLGVNTNILADQDNSNNTISHSSNAGNMQDDDQINRWGASGSTTIDAIQTTQADKPRWETDASDLGGVNFKAALKFMDLDTQINCTGACSFAIRLKPTNFNAVRTIIGSTNTEFIHLGEDGAQIRLKVDNNQINFTHATEAIPTNKYTLITITRNSSNQWNAYVRIFGGGQTEKQWGTADQVQAGTFTVTNLGCKANDSANFDGFMKDVLIYNGTALSSAERAELYNYIGDQNY
jgi:hypothetical protein